MSTGTAYYLYTVHASNTFVASPSLAAALYMCTLKMLSRQYLHCAAFTVTVFTDQPLTGIAVHHSSEH